MKKINILLLMFFIFFNVCLLGQEIPIKSPPVKSPPEMTQKGPFKSPYESGVLTLNFEYIDDLLFLDKVPSIRIIEITYGTYKGVSSAHLALLLRWVNSGGIIWINQEGFNSALFKKVNPGILFKEVIVKKESGATFSQDTGELFVKGLLPQISIANHPITEGVTMLYISPYSKEFAAAIMTEPKIKIVPIISFKSSEDGLLIDSSVKKTSLKIDSSFKKDSLLIDSSVKKDSLLIDSSGKKSNLKIDSSVKKDRLLIDSTDKEDSLLIDSTDTKDEEDKIFILLGLIEKGNGLLIIDTTRLGSKDRAGPGGNEYDWLQFYTNIKSYSHRKAPL